jgi:hypothetical protein
MLCVTVASDGETASARPLNGYYSKAASDPLDVTIAVQHPRVYSLLSGFCQHGRTKKIHQPSSCCVVRRQCWRL